MNNINKRIFGNEKKYLKEVLKSDFRSSKGAQMMRRLEESFAKRFGVEFAISFVNGTTTMHAALEAYGIGVGDEVIVPPLTMAATTFCVLQCGATPVFADVDEKTFQICPKSIKKNITPKTKAIITVGLFGLSPDMDPIMNLAKKNNLFVIEDNAECFLGYYKGKLAGTIGHCASFSFQSSKHLTSGEGGIIITDDSALANRIRKVQSLGYAGVSANKGKITKLDIQDPNYDRHEIMGWNYRMPELCCAVALAQVENIDQLVSHRQKVASIFQEKVEGFEDWFMPQHVPDNCINSYWTWVCRLNTEKVDWHKFRDKFVELGGDGIYAAWKLTYMEPMFKKLDLLGRDKFISEKNLLLYKSSSCPIAEKIQSELLCFKTNYWNINDAYAQADILSKTLKYFA